MNEPGVIPYTDEETSKRFLPEDDETPFLLKKQAG